MPQLCGYHQNWNLAGVYSKNLHLLPFLHGYKGAGLHSRHQYDLIPLLMIPESHI
jgi:hypothetical protein